MRAILIDAVNREVREVQNEGGLQGWYAALNCDRVSLAYPIDEVNSIIVDDEGMLTGPQHFFANLYPSEPQYLAGSGLIVGVDKEGDTADCTLSVEDVREMVRFFNLDEVRREVSK